MTPDSSGRRGSVAPPHTIVVYASRARVALGTTGALAFNVAIGAASKALHTVSHTTCPLVWECPSLTNTSRAQRIAASHCIDLR
jgi:hypothetical protein